MKCKCCGHVFVPFEYFVINRNDYIGESTASEIAYARANGKNVSYMFEHKEQ